jgi:hypothetical protein
MFRTLEYVTLFLNRLLKVFNRTIYGQFNHIAVEILYWDHNYYNRLIYTVKFQKTV